MYKHGEFYISDKMMIVIKRYIEKGVIPGRFLKAVIRNDLKMAVGYADEENARNIPAFVAYFYNEAPGNCWGSEEIMYAYSKKVKEAEVLLEGVER